MMSDITKIMVGARIKFGFSTKEDIIRELPFDCELVKSDDYKNDLGLDFKIIKHDLIKENHDLTEMLGQYVDKLAEMDRRISRMEDK